MRVADETWPHLLPVRAPACVRPGVVTGFLGPNGSGKSTTMPASETDNRRVLAVLRYLGS